MFTARGGRIVLFEHMHELVCMHASVLIDGDNTCQLRRHTQWADHGCMYDGIYSYMIPES